MEMGQRAWSEIKVVSLRQALSPDFLVELQVPTGPVGLSAPADQHPSSSPDHNAERRSGRQATRQAAPVRRLASRTADFT